MRYITGNVGDGALFYTLWNMHEDTVKEFERERLLGTISSEIDLDKAALQQQATKLYYMSVPGGWKN